MKNKTIFMVFGTLLLFMYWNCQEQAKIDKPVTSASPAAARFQSYCQYFQPPVGTPNTFSLSQDYPDTFDAKAAQPWMAIDFKKDYKAYMKAVLDYCMEGNLEVDFKVQDNKVRKWYSAPWMDNNGVRPDTSTKAQNNGREYWHGLTREIAIDPKRLHTSQVTTYQTYAIAFYNELGGYTIGKVWKDANKPNLRQSKFEDGTVTFKLLFTEADTTQVPYLANSKKWKANIYVPFNEVKKRQDTDVRLLQLDIAVNDPRAKETGWVFGTFVYDASSKGKTWVERMVPVGLMWGDDPQDTTMLNIKDRYNPSLKQSVINQSIVGAAGKAPNQAYVTHLGMGGRTNGPVDNPISSCISCHARAAITEEGFIASIAKFGATYKYADFQTYFSEIPCGVSTISQKDTAGVDIKYTGTDYSFQLTNGIRNFKAVQPKPKAGERDLLKASKPIPMLSRDGRVE